mmetsp:Transcript_26809/g.63927  ORF Transcript_26809/g.63927 Transcript_26809/m.63927 type:complete len:870 (-) Transcript_26809:344-2953(-)
MNFDDSDTGTVGHENLHDNRLKTELERAKVEGLLDDDGVNRILKLSSSLTPIDIPKTSGLAKGEGKSDEDNAIRLMQSYEEQQDSEDPKKFLDFFNVLLQMTQTVCKDPDESAYFVVIAESKKDVEELFEGTKIRTDDLRQWAKSFDGEKVVVVVFESKKTGVISFKPEEFTIRVAEEKFGINRNRSKLEEYCNARLLPLADGWNTGGVVEPQLRYVKVEEGMNELENYNYETQLDKSYAFVIAGESGSGKSVFSCLQVKKRHKYLPVYLLLHEEHKVIPKPAVEFKEIHKILRQIIDSLVHQEDRKDDVDDLCEIKRKLNATRNKWAVDVFEAILKKFAICPPPPRAPDEKKKLTKLEELRNDDFHHQDNIQSWLKGEWADKIKPEKVAIILDEATDIDLVEGIIEEVRVLKSKWKRFLAKEDLMIVLTGTGLDSIRSPGRVGTNPAYSRLVKLKGPNLEALQRDYFGDMTDDPDGLMAAVKQGLFSNVLKSNSRMFFRGVLPIFRSHVVVTDITKQKPERKRQRYAERCREVGSFGPIMDYSVRFYVDEHSVGELDAGKRLKLLACSFFYHLISSIQRPLIEHETILKIQEKELNAANKIRDMIGISNDDEEQVFSRGLATRSGTSSALKYLACYGLTCLVRPAFGNEFEELVALHYIRLMDVQGYIIKRFTLRHAWPPKANSKGITKDLIETLQSRLQDNKKSELDGLVLPDGKKWCIVFSQGTPSAQGGDVLAAVRDENQVKIDAHQCKHFKDIPVKSKTTQWWSSVGVEHDGSSWHAVPTKGKALYSYTGLEAFRQLLEERISSLISEEITVTLGKRIMAMSNPMPLNTDFPMPDLECTGVWFREMLEPTISTFELREPQKPDE